MNAAKWSVAVLPEDEERLCKVVPIVIPAPEWFKPCVFAVRRDQVEAVVKVIIDTAEMIENTFRTISA